MATDELELAAQPELNIVTFRFRQGGDDLNSSIPGIVQLAGDVFLIGTRVQGAEAIRACFMHHQTTDADVDRIVPAVVDARRTLEAQTAL